MLRARLLASEDFDVVGTASTSKEALELVAELRPDVVLVDINLGTESGFALARALSEAPDSARHAGHPHLDARGGRLRGADRGESRYRVPVQVVDVRCWDPGASRRPQLNRSWLSEPPST